MLMSIISSSGKLLDTISTVQHVQPWIYPYVHWQILVSWFSLLLKLTRVTWKSNNLAIVKQFFNQKTIFLFLKGAFSGKEFEHSDQKFERRRENKNILRRSTGERHRAKSSYFCAAPCAKLRINAPESWNFQICFQDINAHHKKYRGGPFQRGVPCADAQVCLIVGPALMAES